MEFAGKVVLITGAAGGIGRAAAKAFAEQGAKLALVDLKLEAVEELSGRIGAKEVLPVAADVTKEADVEQYVQKTVDRFGRIDVFLNNAGVEGKYGLITETSAENLDFVINVNIKGVYYGLKHVLRVMKKQKSGSIVNTASVAGLSGSAGMAPYILSKHAVIGLTKTAALESASDGIRVNAVCPGPINTRMMRSIEEGTMPGKGELVKSQLEQSIPLKRYGEAEEVAQVMLFLASERASYITGCYYRVDGGMGASSS